MANVKNSHDPTSSLTKYISEHDKYNNLLIGFDNDKITELLLNQEESCHLVNFDNADDIPVKNKDRDTVLIKETVLIKNKPLKREIQLTKDRLLDENGYLKLKSKDNLKLCNNILMTELLIDNNKEKHHEPTKSNNLNNNDTVTNNRNKRKSSKDGEKSDEKKRKIVSAKSDIKKNLDHSKRKKSSDASTKNGQNKVKKKTVVMNLDSGHLMHPRREKKRLVKKGLFICDICCRQFDTRSSIMRHMCLHLFRKKYPCPQCNRVFHKKLYLQAHTKRLHPDWDQHYMCNLCNKPFLTKENLAVHMSAHNNTETMFKCIYCKEKFAQQNQVIEHEKQHLVNGEYKCSLCNRGFQNRNKLSAHLKGHLKVKEFICQHCGKEFLRASSLRRHVQVSHERVRIQCMICKKRLKGHLKEHMRTHENYRPHKCEDCGQCFAQSTQLTVHRRSHTGLRPYTCRICKRPFTHSNGLMMHIRVHTGEKPFECPLCPLAFTQLPHMKSHMYKIHGKENPYRCKECMKYFKLKKDLENHTKICNVDSKEEAVQLDENVVEETAVKLSRLRFLLALLLTMIASKGKLKYLGFNKRLIDDLLVESLEAMGQSPCKKESFTPLKRLEQNVDKLLKGTVPKEKMKKFRKQGRSTEEILELLTDEKK